ncbi:hypothetical protein FJZ48_03920 [Candidatus Uhrbacteria bacterium]|nr:hypothetical protein [Candidatus Uhrbacteria bacterium]
MQLIRPISWEEVFDGWRVREANNPAWIECATKIKGWPDWESWRSFIAKQFDAENRKWKIFQFENPLEEIPEMFIGPYSGWQSRVNNKNHTTFKELLEIPGQFDEWGKHSGVLAIMKGLPFPTELIGIIRKDTDKIVCIEGHHRATAIALAKKQGQIIDFSETPVTIALTELATENCRLLDDVLQRGASKNPQS